MEPKALVVRRAYIPETLNDPLEPLNRGLWNVNKVLLDGVVGPASTAYRTVVPAPVRTSLGNVTRNVTYPGRLINHALQGRWDGAGVETKRFLYNTTVGIGGLFDPATKSNMPKSEASFSQTFSSWGWRPNNYIVLPFLGPSDDLHAVGLGADRLAEPWNYATPYIYASYASTFNSIAGSTDEIIRASEVESDFYAFSKYVWTYASKENEPTWATTNPPDRPTLQTLAATAIRRKDPQFLCRGRQLKVTMPTTGRQLKANYWLQKTTAPIAYVAPGLGSHRLSLNTLALAEQLFSKGFSVVTTSSLFHPEFQENASTTALPVYPPADSLDLLNALTQIDSTLMKKHAHLLGKRALVGFSMGGFFTARIAAFESSAPAGTMKFDRYLAISPPVDLHYGENRLDEYQNVPQGWPAEQRQAKINNTLHKATAGGIIAAANKGMLPLDASESKYLIGLAFRLTLRDIIYTSQQRHNLGILKTPLSKWRREACYNEILTYSYNDYLHSFAAPYYQSVGVSLQELVNQRTLKSHEARIRKQTKLRVIENENDFLITKQDLKWLKSTLGDSRLTVFKEGGHLGNLVAPDFQKAVSKALEGLH